MKKFNPSKKTSAIIIAILSVFVFFSMLSVLNKHNSRSGPGTTESSIYGKYTDYSSFMASIKKDDGFDSVEGQVGSSIVTARKGAVRTHTIAPNEKVVFDKATEAGIPVVITPAPKPSPYSSGLFLFLLPTMIMVVLFLYLHKKSTENQNRILRPPVQPGKGVVDPKSNPTRLSDVAGCDEVKTEVAEIISFLKNPEQYTKLGARPPKGILMVGPPGTGKTLLAKAIAGEAGVPFFSRSGSDFVEVFVGVGAMRIRELFEQAKSCSPAIIFIDEIDAVGRARTSSGPGGGASDEREQTLNQLLVEMDGFSLSSNVVVIAATNRSDVLDQALLRPGRFDREVMVNLPDKAGRTSILKVHGAKIPVSLDVSWEKIASGTPGFSGADLSNLVNEAAILAAREEAKVVTPTHFSLAIDKILMGAQRSPMTNQAERYAVAYHEAGHALVAHFSEHAEPVHKISIVPRGRALGVTMQVPKEDSYNHGLNRLTADIAVLMGGRAAEDLIVGEPTTGASNDFKRATQIARRIVASYGMDDSFGQVSIDGEYGDNWAARGLWSEETKREVDLRVISIVKAGYAKASAILKDNKDILDEVAASLLETETMDRDQFEMIVMKNAKPEESLELVNQD